MNKLLSVFGMCFILLSGCTNDSPPDFSVDIPEMTGAELSRVPSWAKSAIWYQVFVERFRNGDKSNDPTLADMEGSWPHEQPDGWATTPWTWDWYQQEDWAVNTGKPFYHTVQLRRYGGDLQGVLDQLDYLQDLGVTAIYLNPINDSPSLHKYDARNYHHVDRNFGPDPQQDLQTIAGEDPTDPSTWKWTTADQLFLNVLDAAHQRGMRVVLDYSWNHTGQTFWAFEDVIENQKASEYADWYIINTFDDPATVDTSEFSYEGWAGVHELPEIKKTDVADRVHGLPYEGDLYQPVKDHILHVTRRWMDPNGDGNPADGVDGFRLDVAEQVPLGFWRDYRKFVKSINPEALLVGEIWWEQWPDRMADPAPYLAGDVFDSVMNYRWFKATRDFVSGGSAATFVQELDSLKTGISDPFRAAMMNLAASHDSPRVGTSLFNGGRYKFRVRPNENPAYLTSKPGQVAKERQQVLLAHQFTYIGAPHIWYGDEVGMWGADDPDTRKPMLWSDMAYSPEKTRFDQTSQEPDVVQPDETLRALYRNLANLRIQNAGLFVDGEMEIIVATDTGVLAYRRQSGDRMAIIFLNASDATTPLTGNLAGNISTDMTFRNALDASESYVADADMPVLTFELAPRSFKILINE